ncbi:MAG: hypothetical protein ACTHOJ_15630 [Sphingomonas oligoaromativorans]
MTAYQCRATNKDFQALASSAVASQADADAWRDMVLAQFPDAVIRVIPPPPVEPPPITQN